MGCFNCSRTCRTHEAVDVCRFSALLTAIGVVGVVNSHTTTVDVKLRSPTALAAACRLLGGEVIGQGTHMLQHEDRPNPVVGYGIKLPGWHYPIVLTAAGKLAVETDDTRFYSQQPGVHTVAKLTATYVLCAAREAAGNLGWRVVENTPESVTIKHSSGGTLKVSSNGVCEAFGFTGTDCHATRAIESAIGEMKDRQFKPEYHTMRRMGVRAKT